MSNLRLNELIIVQGDKYVYHEKFDHKINIIRGDNSTGKSSIANFIFFILGGEFTEFLPEAKKCDYVLAELLINDTPVTVRRNIDKNDKYHVMTKRPMYINIAPLEKAIQSQIEGWKIYQYSQTDRQESFSQKLFQLLNFPDISSENQETITMNQILRLIYIDQLSNLSDLMRNEDFDSPSVRDAIGNLLLGTYSDEKLKFERQLKEVKKEYDKISTQTAAMKDVFKESSFEYNTTKIQAEIEKLEQQLQKINNSIANPEDILKNAKPSVTKKELDTNRNKLIQVKTKYQDLNEELKNTNLAYIDGKEFIKVIEDKISDIEISIKTRKSFGALELKYCPACFEKLENASEHQCSLCKQDIPDEVNLSRFSRMKLELEMQLKESKNLLQEREIRIKELKQLIRETGRALNSAQKDYDLLTRKTSNTASNVLEQLFEKKGSLKFEIQYLQKQLDLISSYEEYRIRAEQLKSQQERLKDQIEDLNFSQRKKSIEAYKKINYYALKLVHSDGDYEEKFKEGKKTSISFRENKYYLDNRNRFSASSMVVLKNCIRFAIFFASVELDFFRFPKFIICDNIEDKGMVDERSKNFQNKVVEIANSDEIRNKDYQIIFTTSKISEELNVPEYTVGKSYTPTKKSLVFEGLE